MAGIFNIEATFFAIRTEFPVGCMVWQFNTVVQIINTPTIA